MEFLLGEDPTFEKCIDSKEAKITYLLVENNNLKSQLSDCKRLLNSRDTFLTKNGSTVSHSMMRESICHTSPDRMIDETSEMYSYIEENKRLQEMVETAQNAREEEAARALLNKQLSYLSKYQYQQILQDLEDRVKEMYEKIVQKEEVLQKIEKTAGIAISENVIYMKRDVVSAKEQELVLHSTIEHLRSTLYEVIVQKNKLEVKNQVLSEKCQVIVIHDLGSKEENSIN